MPTNHEAVGALPVVGAPVKASLRDLLVRRMAYCLGDPDDALDLVAVDPASGATILALIANGRLYWFDGADTTTAHDGVSTLVSNEGKRYKLESVDVVLFSLLDRDLSAPPGSPSLGDAYLVATAATGAWAGHDDEIAVYTARGWEFIDAVIGRLVYLEDEDTYVHKDALGDWVTGFGSQALPEESILPSMMLGGAGRIRFIVENQTTNAPPGVVNGTAYVIGSSPTGAWSGNAGKIAHGEVSSWVIYAPSEGWRIYDKALDGDYLYNGSAWVSGSGRWTATLQVFTAAGANTYTKPARLFGALVWLVGAGADAGGNGGSSSFGSHCSATGGTSAGVGGTGSGGDWNFPVIGGVGASPGNYHGTGNGGGGGGGGAVKFLDAASIGASESVTVGLAPGGGTTAVGGAVYVINFIEA